VKSLPLSLHFVFLLSSATLVFAQVIGGVIGTRDAPFSAETVNESSQKGRDGKPVQHETHGRLYRDSEGRTRGEFELESSQGKRLEITIVDPVENLYIELDPTNKTATVEHSVISPPANASSPIESTLAMPGVRTEKLESKVIEGLAVSGKRYSTVMNPGSNANTSPITQMSEVWYSDELKTVLLVSTTLDGPHAKQTVMRLTNIRKGDPDPKLFQIPTDYTVKDVPSQQ